MTGTGQVSDAPGGTAALAGRTVARIGFGAMQLERSGAGREAARAVLRAAIGAGVNHVDTAGFYGSVNEVIRDALAPYPDGLVLATKVGAVRTTAGQLVPAQRPEQLREQVEDNLTALGTDQIAMVNLRRLDAPPGIVAEGGQQAGLEDQLAELAALREAGKIGGIGLSAVSAAQLGQALPARIACVQNGYSVLERSAEPVLAACREHGIAWVPFFPLGSAFPGRPKAAEDPVVTAVAAQLGATPAQVALAWLLDSYDHTLLIPGTADPGHLAENLAAGRLELPASARDTLDRLA